MALCIVFSFVCVRKYLIALEFHADHAADCDLGPLDTATAALQASVSRDTSVVDEVFAVAATARSVRGARRGGTGRLKT